MILGIRISATLLLFLFTLAARASAQVTISDYETISSDRFGIYALSSDVTSKDIFVGSNVTVTVSSDNATQDNFAAGLYAHGEGASIDAADSLKVSVDGNHVSGVVADEQGVIETGASAYIATSGESARGVVAKHYSSIDVGDSITIATSGNDSEGIYAAQVSAVDVGDAANITTSGANSSGVWAFDESRITIGAAAIITTSDDRSYGIFSGGTSSVSIEDAAIITTLGINSHGAEAILGSIDIGESAKITTSGAGAHAVYARQVSQIRLNGAEMSATGAGAAAIVAENTSRVTGSGLFDITGDMVADDVISDTISASYADISLTMTDGSLFTGGTMLNGDNATINLTLDGPASKWNVIGDSVLTSLEINGSAVDFTGSAPGTTITAGTLSGTGGALTMKTDISGGMNDKLLVTGTSSGAYTITAANDGSAATDGTERLTIVQTADNGASFSLANDLELGAWAYSLQRVPVSAASEFQIQVVAPPDVTSPDVTSTDVTQAVAVNTFNLYSTGLSNAASAAVNTVASGYLMGYAGMNTLTQRLGELRDTPHMSGFWAMVYGGEFNTDGMRLGKEFNLEYGGVNIGYDRKIETGLPGDLYAGVMFGYGKGDIGFAYADGDGGVDSKTIGVYGIYRQDDGLYIDAALKYQWMDYDFNTFDSAGARVTANDVNTGGFGFSVEAGKRFKLNNGWYVEPQAQLSYLKQDGGTFNMSNGLSLSSDGWTSLQGRLGARLGYENVARGLYAKVSWVNEFDGDFDFNANGEPFTDSFGDNWWVYGIGYVSKLNDRNSLYLDIERSSGGVFEQDWAIEAGWRIIL